MRTLTAPRHRRFIRHLRGEPCRRYRRAGHGFRNLCGRPNLTSASTCLPKKATARSPVSACTATATIKYRLGLITCGAPGHRAPDPDDQMACRKCQIGCQFTNPGGKHICTERVAHRLRASCNKWGTSPAWTQPGRARACAPFDDEPFAVAPSRAAGTRSVIGAEPATPNNGPVLDGNR